MGSRQRQVAFLIYALVLQDAELTVENLKQNSRSDIPSDPLTESQVIDDSMAIEMRQFDRGFSGHSVLQQAPIQWEMEEAKLKVDKNFTLI